MSDQHQDYYKRVADYYDEDANLGFEARANVNIILEKIRNDFRAITTDYPLADVLEIGCGPGFDVVWFAQQYPEAKFTAVDISPEMIRLTNQRIKKLELTNARAMVSDERNLVDHFGEGAFDLIYVYFGALNTVSDLKKSADIIHRLLRKDGVAVLTFVNKWYMRELLVQLLKLNFKTAMARLGKTWGGYSVDRNLESHCYSPAFIRHAFSRFSLLRRKGYSIFYPPWYNQHKIKDDPRKEKRLWDKDQNAQRSFLWALGEYTLFVFRKTE